jgi:hypothetical protein
VAGRTSEAHALLDEAIESLAEGDKNDQALHRRLRAETALRRCLA